MNIFFVCNIQITSQLCTVNGHHPTQSDSSEGTNLLNDTQSDCSEGTNLLNDTDLPAVDLMC